MNKKVKWENYANSYATKMLEKKYSWLKIILKAIAIILNFLNRYNRLLRLAKVGKK